MTATTPARNVEIKARIDTHDGVRDALAALANGEPLAISQDDTFFRCGRGRLKLRTFADGSGELIFYRREDAPGPKTSLYLLFPTSAPDVLRATLSMAYGEAGRVRKVRTLYLVGRTRVHLDDVEGLGRFLELEVVLKAGEPASDGVKEATMLMTTLGIDASQLVEGAYVDLLARAAPPVRSGKD